LTPAELREWAHVRHQPLTDDDWVDMHNTLEDFKRRRIARALEAKAAK
jgi:hypothetical protein